MNASDATRSHLPVTPPAEHLSSEVCEDPQGGGVYVVPQYGPRATASFSTADYSDAGIRAAMYARHNGGTVVARHFYDTAGFCGVVYEVYGGDGEALTSQRALERWQRGEPDPEPVDTLTFIRGNVNGAQDQFGCASIPRVDLATARARWGGTAEMGAAFDAGNVAAVLEVA